MPPLPDDEEARRRAKIEADIKANEEAARARNAARLATARNLETFNPPVLGASPVRSGARYEQPDLTAGSPEPEKRYIPPVDDPIRDAPGIVASPMWDPSLAIPAARDGSGIFGVGSGGPEDPVPGPLTEAQVIELKQWKDNRDAGVQSFEMRSRLMDGADPEAAARALELSQRTGASRLEVQSDPEGYSRLDLMSQVDKLRETSPRTLTWLNAYPDNFDIAHDDTESLSWWDSISKSFGDAFARTDALKAERGRRDGAGMGALTDYPLASDLRPGVADASGVAYGAAVTGGALKSGFATTTSGIYGMARSASELNDQFASWVAGRKLESVPSQWLAERQQAAKISADEWMPKVDDPTLQGALQGIHSLPTSAFTIATAMMTGGSSIAGAAVAGGVTAGDEYGTAREQGMDPLSSAGYGTTQGILEAAWEVPQLKFLIGDMNKQTPFGEMLFKQALVQGVTEQGATHTQDFVSWALLPANRDKTIDDYIAERPAAAYQTLIASMVGTGVQTTTAKLLNEGLKAIDEGYAQKRAEDIANMVRAMGDKAADSKLLKRMPDKYREAVAAITKDGPLENIRVDGEAFSELAQEKGIPVERLAQAFRIDPADAMMAIESGQDVVIPSGNYAAVIQTGKKELGIAGTEIHTALAPNIRLRADDFTAKEAAAMKQVVADEQAARESDEAGTSFASAADRVREDSRQTLAATGRFNAETTAVQFVIFAELIITLAERTNQDPEKLWADYKASVESKIKADEDELSQGGDRAPVEVDDDTLQRASERLTEYEFAVWKAATLEGRTNSDIADDPAIEELRLKQYVTRSEKDAMPSREGISVVLNRARNKGFSAPEAKRGRGDAIKDDVKRLIKLGLTSKQIHERLGRPAELRNSTNAQVSKIKKEMREAGELAQSSLPMDEASRMQRAREMGFDVDTPLYHGRGNEVETLPIGTKARQQELGRGVYLTSNRDGAAGYAQQRAVRSGGGNGVVYKVFVRGSFVQSNGSVALRSLPKEMQQKIKKETPWLVKNTSQGNNHITLPDLARMEGGAEFLRSAGIDGLRRGDELVVFDPANIRRTDATFDPSQEGSSKLLAQDQTENRGGFTGMNLSQEAVIRLYESANLSTFVHETAHWYLTTLEKMARTAPAATRASASGSTPELQRAQKLLDALDAGGVASNPILVNNIARSLGLVVSADAAMAETVERIRVTVAEASAKSSGTAESERGAHPFVIEQLAAIRNWAGKHPEFEIYDASGQITPEGVEVHEAFAETFEAYLREGKAPSTAMRSVFAAFKSWLMRVYRSITEIGGRVRLNEEISAVFDRALATDEAIAAVRKGMDKNAEAMAKTMLDKGVITQRQYERTKARLVEAKEKAEADLMARLMEQYERNQKVWWREEERDIRRDVQSEIDERPEQRAYQVFTGEGWRDTLEDHVEKAAREQLELAQEQGLFEPNANDETLRILQMRAVEAGLGPLILLFKTTSGRIIAFPGENGTFHHDIARQMLGLGNLKLQHGMYNPRRWPTIEAMNADTTGAAWYATTGEQADAETRELAHTTYSHQRHREQVKQAFELLKENPELADGPLSKIMELAEASAYAADRARRLYRSGDELRQGDGETVVYRGSAEDEAGVTENGRLGLGLYSAEDPEIGAEWGGATGKVEAYRINGRLFDLDETTAEGLENYEKQEDTPAAQKLFARLKAEGYVGIRDPWSGHINVFDAKDMIRAPELDTELGDTWTNDPELGQLRVNSFKAIREASPEDLAEWFDEKVVSVTTPGRGTLLRLSSELEKADPSWRIVRDIDLNGESAWTVQSLNRSLNEWEMEATFPTREEADQWVAQESASDNKRDIEIKFSETSRDGFNGFTVDMAFEGRLAGVEPSSPKAAREGLAVFNRTVAAIKEHMRRTKPDYVVFTGSGDEQSKLYDFLVRSFSFEGYEGRIDHYASDLIVNDASVFGISDTKVFTLAREDIATQLPINLENPVVQDGQAPGGFREVSKRYNWTEIVQPEPRSAGAPDGGRDQGGRTDAGRDAGAQGELGQSRQLDAMGFYSALREAVANSKQTKASAEQWKATLEKLPGVKAEEIEWTGVKDWLDIQQGQVTRADLEGFLDSNGVRVEEVQKSNILRGINTQSEFYVPALIDAIKGAGSYAEAEMQLANDRGFYRYFQQSYPEIFEELEGSTQDIAERVSVDLFGDDYIERDQNVLTEFDQFTLPGGEDYTELLLTLPSIKGPATHWTDNGNKNVVAHARFKTRYAPVPTTEQEEADNRAWNDAQPAIDLLRDEVRALSAQRARELHDGGYAYDREPPSTPSLAPLQAAVDKLRAAEAALPKPIDRNRRQKVLALEEIQSDWHQKGRKQGYRAEFDQAKLDAAQAKLDEALGARSAANAAAVEARQALTDIVTSPPFVQILDTIDKPDAIVNRADELKAFASSKEPQTSSNMLHSALAAMRLKREYTALPQEAKDTLVSAQAALDLADNAAGDAMLREREAGIARDMARNPAGIPRAPFEGSHKWSALVLKRMIRYAAENGFDQIAWIPGDVQNGAEVDADDNRADFYDKVVVNAANKIGKKYGATVGTSNIRIRGSDGGRKVDYDQPFHSLPITPQLKAAAMEGMPLFHTGTRRGRIAPPPSIPPMRLDLRAVEEQYGPEALAALPPRVRAHSASATDADQFVQTARDVLATLKKKAPRSLSTFLARKRTIGEGNDKITYSGIRDPDGEILAMIGKRSEARGLIATPENDSKKSRSYSYEEAAHAAWEEGYFNGDSPPEIAEFLDALRADFDGTAKLYRSADQGIVQQIDNANEWANWFDQNEIDINEENDAVLRTAIETKLSSQAENAIGPDEAAPFFKMADGRALLEGLKQGPQRDRLIREETRRRMIERHGDIFNDGTIMEAAREFAANEVQQRQYEIELEALSNASGKQAAANLARETAKELLRDKQVREVLNYNQWLILSERWGKKALEAAEKGDFAKAADAKRYQMINSAMFREGRKLAETADKAVKRIKSYDTKPQRIKLATAGQDYLDQMDQLLEGYDFKKRTNKVLRERVSLAQWFAQKQSEMDPLFSREGMTPEELMRMQQEEIDRSDALAAMQREATVRNYVSLTVDELLSVRDQADMIARTARQVGSLMEEGERRSLRLAIDDIIARIAIAKPKKLPPESYATFAPKESAKRGRKEYMAELRTMQALVRMIDGMDNGPLAKNTLQKLNPAYSRRIARTREEEKRIVEIYREAFGDKLSDLRKGQMRFPGVEVPLSKLERLSVALNMGTEISRKRLRDGYGWDDATLQSIINSLSAKDWQFVTSMWTYINSLYPEANAAHIATHGVPLTKQDGIPIVTPFGVIEGQYFPLVYDPHRSSRAEQKALDAEAKQVAGRVGTRNASGFTKERVKGRVTMPVLLDFSIVVPRHVDQVVASITTQKALLDVGRVIVHPDVEQAIVERHGRLVYKQLLSALREARNGQETARLSAERALVRLRNGATIVGLGLNMKTAILQIGGHTNSVVRLGGPNLGAIGGLPWLMKGVYRMGIGAQGMQNGLKFIVERSEYMRNRRESQNREMADLRRKLEGGRIKGAMQTFMEQASMFMIVRAQYYLVDGPLWLGAYEKAQASGMSEADAVSSADQTVIDAQGGGEVYQLAGIQRGSPLLKLFTNFLSYSVTTWNLNVNRTRGTNFRNPAQAAAWALDMAILNWAPVLITIFAASLMAPGGDDDEQDLQEQMLRGQLSFMMSQWGLFGQMGSAINEFSYSGPQGTRAFSDASKAVQAAGKDIERLLAGEEMTGDVIRPLNLALGAWFHYPAAALERFARGAWALAEGDTQDPKALLVGPPRE